MSIYWPIGLLAVGVFISGMVIGHPLVQRRARARTDAEVNRLRYGLAPDPGEIRSHRRPRGWNVDHTLVTPSSQRRHSVDRPAPVVATAAYVPAHASDGVTSWDTYTYPGRHAYGSVRPIVDIGARAAYDATVLYVQAIIRSVHSGGRELVGVGR